MSAEQPGTLGVEICELFGLPTDGSITDITIALNGWEMPTLTATFTLWEDRRLTKALERYELRPIPGLQVERRHLADPEPATRVDKPAPRSVEQRLAAVEKEIAVRNKIDEILRDARQRQYEVEAERGWPPRPSDPNPFIGDTSAHSEGGGTWWRRRR